MTVAEDLKRLKKLKKEAPSDDSHVEADRILLKYVPKEIADAWDEIEMWFS